jgi:hypothetical protein
MLSKENQTADWEGHQQATVVSRITTCRLGANSWYLAACQRSWLCTATTVTTTTTTAAAATASATTMDFPVY